MLTSAGGILAILQDNPEVSADSAAEDIQLKVQLTQFALRRLDTIVDEFWAEISDSIQIIEVSCHVKLASILQLFVVQVVFEDKMYPADVRQLAALVASKVYYHLGSYEDSLSFALGAESLFDVTNTKSQYVETIIAKCIDKYTKERQAEASNIDNRLEEIVNRMFDRCFEHGQYRQALGIAIETRRLDIFERAISHDLPDSQKCDMLSYAFRVVMSLIQSRDYRCQLLKTLVGLYRGLATPDYVQMCQCHIFLDEPLAVAEILEKLSTGSPADALMAYQVILIADWLTQNNINL